MSTQSPEFHLIQTYFKHYAQYDDSVALGIGDDCALINTSANTEQAISVDTSIIGRHFPADADPYYIACRALNSSLSDLAAMGARARWFTLAISLPTMDDAWLAAFSKGLFAAANKAGAQLIGGDTTKSDTLTITVQVQGEVAKGTALLRSGAQIGDTVYVSGELGNAAAGLALYQQGIRQGRLYEAYINPQPQLVLGQQLLGHANSCIDISDGLLADLSHILKASQCAAKIDANKLPLAKEVLDQFSQQQATLWALSGGDDYQLCFTSAHNPEQLKAQGIKAHAIGEIVAGTGYTVENLSDDIQLQQRGFDHFYEPSIQS